MGLVYRILLLFLCPLFCMGASYGALSDDDAGLLVYHKSSGKILVFRSCSENDQLWQCTPFRGRRSFKVYPRYCSLLNYTEDQLTPELVVLELAYWTARGSRVRYAYEEIAKKMNSPLINNLLDFYTSLQRSRRTIDSKIDEYNKAERRAFQDERKQADAPPPPSGGSIFGGPRAPQPPPAPPRSRTEADLIKSEMSGAFTNDELLQKISDAAGENNFFLAFCMYISYRNEMLNLARALDPEDRKTVTEDIQKQGEDIRELYCAGRSENQNRVNNFKSICKDKHGPWEFANPTDLADMRRHVDSCYLALQKTYTLSPYSEFPDWGNAMLEVLQMIRNTAWIQRYDAASAEFEKYNSN